MPLIVSASARVRQRFGVVRRSVPPTLATMSITRIPRDQLVYGFNAQTPPVATIQPGDEVVFETYDTSTGRIFEPEDVPKFVAVRDPKKVNPAAGPVYVEGAAPGDALAVDI